MNVQRRKQLEKVIEQLSNAYDELKAISEEEEEAYNNMPENLQNSERGEAMQRYIDDMEISYIDIDSVMDTLQQIIDE